ncbi:MAG: hypothetical protein WDZ41_05440 [Candidatus Babeliales bacterium]
MLKLTLTLLMIILTFTIGSIFAIEEKEKIRKHTTIVHNDTDVKIDVTIIYGVTPI